MQIHRLPIPWLHEHKEYNNLNTTLLDSCGQKYTKVGTKVMPSIFF
jgi:hypothetical protein